MFHEIILEVPNWTDIVNWSPLTNFVTTFYTNKPENKDLLWYIIYIFLLLHHTFVQEGCLQLIGQYLQKRQALWLFVCLYYHAYWQSYLFWKLEKWFSIMLRVASFDLFLGHCLVIIIFLYCISHILSSMASCIYEKVKIPS